MLRLLMVQTEVEPGCVHRLYPTFPLPHPRSPSLERNRSFIENLFLSFFLFRFPLSLRSNGLTPGYPTKEILTKWPKLPKQEIKNEVITIALKENTALSTPVLGKSDGILHQNRGNSCRSKREHMVFNLRLAKVFMAGTLMLWKAC